MGGAKQAKGVVLLGGQAVPAEKLVLEDAEPVVGAPEIEINFLLRRVEPLPVPRRL